MVDFLCLHYWILSIYFFQCVVLSIKDDDVSACIDNDEVLVAGVMGDKYIVYVDICVSFELNGVLKFYNGFFVSYSASIESELGIVELSEVSVLISSR